MPKQALVRVSELYQLANRLHEFGIVTGKVTIDWSAAVDRAQRILHGCGDPKPAELTAKGAHLVFGTGRFLDAHTIAVGDERLHGAQILVATGAHTARPPIEGLEHALTHVELLQVRTPPRTLVVIGGGVIAMEFAYIFARLGTSVTVMELMDHVLGNLDGEIRVAVAEHAAALGITLHTGVRVEAVHPVAGAFGVHATSAGGAIDATGDIVLLAAGQVPTVEQLGLELTGVTYDRHGIETDATLRTWVPHIWAAGDVRRGGGQLSPLASHGARTAAGNALLGRSDAFDESLVPYLVGLTPTVAGVGLTEEDCQARGIDTFVHRQSYAGVCPAAQVVGEPIGFVKVIFSRTDRRLIGAHAFGASAGELVQQMAFAMRGGLTARDLADMLFVFPGLSQVLEHALRPAPDDPAGP